MDTQWLDSLGLPRWGSLMHGDDALIKAKQQEYLEVLESIKQKRSQADRIVKQIAYRQEELSRDRHAI